MKNITLTALLCWFTIALSAQKSTFKMPDSCVVANTHSLCVDCGHYYKSKNNQSEALIYFEKAYSLAHKREYLWQIYEIKKALRLPFDTASFFKHDHYNDLMYYAKALSNSGSYDLAATICKKAIAKLPTIEGKLLLHDICKRGKLPFDMKLITTDLTSTKDMTKSAEYLFENEFYDEAKFMYEYSEKISHSHYNIINLHEINLKKTGIFELDIFLKSKDATELMLYSNYFSQSAEEQKKYGDKIPFLKQAILLMESAVLQKDGKQFELALAQNYSNLSFYLLLEANSEEAEKMARKSLALAPEFELANTNLAAALLLQGKYDQAEKVYRQWMDKPLKSEVPQITELIETNGEASPPPPVTFREAFLQDLKDLERVGLTHPDFSKIRALLEKK